MCIPLCKRERNADRQPAGVSGKWENRQRDILLPLLAWIFGFLKTSPVFFYICSDQDYKCFASECFAGIFMQGNSEEDRWGVCNQLIRSSTYGVSFCNTILHAVLHSSLCNVGQQYHLFEALWILEQEGKNFILFYDDGHSHKLCGFFDISAHNIGGTACDQRADNRRKKLVYLKTFLCVVCRLFWDVGRKMGFSDGCYR